MEKESEIWAPLTPEQEKEISMNALMDVEGYLASLQETEPDKLPREPRDSEILAHMSSYNNRRAATGKEIMGPREEKIYDAIFRNRFLEGYIKRSIN